MYEPNKTDSSRFPKSSYAPRKKRNTLLIVLVIVLLLAGAACIVIPFISQKNAYDKEVRDMEESLQSFKIPEGQSTAISTPFNEDYIIQAATPTPGPDGITPRDYVFPLTVDQEAELAEQENHSSSVNEVYFPEYTIDEDIMIPVDDPDEYNAWVFRTPTPKPGNNASSVPTMKPQEKKSKPTATPAPTPKIGKTGVDLAACKKSNSDFVAWIKIPGTLIDYPIVSTNDSDFYLEHTFDKKKSVLGTLFSLGKTSWKSPSKNIAIFGHNVVGNDPRMFSGLRKYKDEGFYSNHKTIYLDSMYRTGTYEVFAAFNMLTGDFDPSKASFADSKDFLNFVKHARSLTPYKTKAAVDSSDTIITLITCDKDYKPNEGRFIVMAVRK